MRKSSQNKLKKVVKPDLLVGQPKHKKRKKMLVLDLDDTLVNLVAEAAIPPQRHDMKLPISLPLSTKRTSFSYVQVRPGFSNFLFQMSQCYQVILYTTREVDYGDMIMDVIDPTRLSVKRLYREHCTQFKHIFFLDMTRLGRRMEDVILLESIENSFRGQESNSVAISPWSGDYNDDELSNLIPFLTDMSKIDDVRCVLSVANQGYEFRQMVANAMLQQLLTLQEEIENLSMIQQEKRGNKVISSPEKKRQNDRKSVKKRQLKGANNLQISTGGTFSHRIDIREHYRACFSLSPTSDVQFRDTRHAREMLFLSHAIKRDQKSGRMQTF